ncbi:MAG: sigma-54 dependent transcriptional regulator [Pseudomonadota bacterium]
MYAGSESGLIPAPVLRVCLVEDDAIMGESLCDRFQLEAFEVDWWRTAGEAARAIASRAYSVVISDVRLPDGSGEQLFRDVRASIADPPPFVFITAFASVDRAVALLKDGAADYVAKPFDLDDLVTKVRSLSHAQRTENAGSEEEFELGVSAAMRRIAHMVPRVARHASAILITGESGVGKEHVAQLIHRRGARAGAPFVPVNCGALAESLLEAELFGYERGAFTGAVRSHRGLLEAASGGTLFLDEIGDMPLPMQVKLLRVIQDHRVMRVGGTAPVPVSFKLVCATHRDLRDLVRSGRFREDLFFRINVIQLRIPPLRERPEDILWFARRFLLECAAAHEVPRFTLSAAAAAALLAYPWPGNLRELRHCIERACILSTSPVLEPAVLFEDGAPPPRDEGAGGSLASYLAACERRYIESVLRQSGGQVGKAAARLGISRKNLWEKVRKLGLRQARVGPS